METRLDKHTWTMETLRINYGQSTQHKYTITVTQSHSQNHSMGEAGRDHSGLSGQTSQYNGEEIWITKTVSTAKGAGSHPNYLEMGVLSAYWDPMNSNNIFSALLSLGCTDPPTCCSKTVYKVVFNEKLKWYIRNTAEQWNSALEQNQKNIA